MRAAMQGRTGIHAKQAVKKGAAPDVKSSNSFFSQDIINQLNTVFAKMERKLQLELHLGFPAREPGIRKLYDRTGKIYR